MSLKPLKFKGAEDSFFVVADLHYRHDRNFIFEKRDFKNVVEHDENLIKRWNETCDKNSIVFHLGDLIFNDSRGEEFWKLVQTLNYKELYLFLGNHTSGHRQAYTSILMRRFPQCFDADGNTTSEVYPLPELVNSGEKKIVFLSEYHEIVINSDNFVMCHYPVLSHNHQSHGSYMLCGHSHSSCADTNKITGKGRRLDVGIESFGRPVSIGFVKNYLKERPYDSRDHH